MTELQPSTTTQHKYNKQYCPHCDRNIPKSTWYAHYSKFFGQTNGKWKTDAGLKSDEPHFDFGANESSCDESGNGEVPEERKYRFENDAVNNTSSDSVSPSL